MAENRRISEKTCCLTAGCDVACLAIQSWTSAIPWFKDLPWPQLFTKATIRFTPHTYRPADHRMFSGPPAHFVPRCGVRGISLASVGRSLRSFIPLTILRWKVSKQILPDPPEVNLSRVVGATNQPIKLLQIRLACQRYTFAATANCPL